MKNPMEGAIEHIKKQGLPMEERMRTDLAAEDVAAFQERVQDKVTEYQTLLDRFKKGEDLSVEEMKRMADLSDELSELMDRSKGIG